ncbi:MAG: hypothetical protein EA400_11435 [Chromatiaceae bacterium]|nr:MAG: hypothetical protein EA400_11435 [Chromatiaceae bacterium]
MPAFLHGLVAAALLTLASAAVADNAAGGTSARFLVSELVPLPHPMRTLRADPQRFGVSEEQLTRLLTEVRGVYAPQIHPRTQRAWALQRQISRRVLEDGAGPAELRSQLDELTTLKREIIELRVAALNQFRAIVSPEVFATLVATDAPATDAMAQRPPRD